ncbi:MAG: hypothetical protein H6726_17505 [Sandaracinaceae bacterium]|nr:hypothetical protein [Sandaracinaceae bacterium]
MNRWIVWTVCVLVNGVFAGCGGGGPGGGSCSDGVVNQDETDIDCGGATCGGCQNGGMCSAPTDCVSGGCGANGVCAPVFTVSGNVVGATGPGLVLQNNGGDDLSVAADGSFTFSTAVVLGAAYNVTVRTGAGTPEQVCVVSQGSGVISADVEDVGVSCVTTPDDIADAIDLREGVELRFSTVDATEETGEVYCDDQGTVWYRFVAPSAGDYVAYATGSDHDTELTWSDGLMGPTYGCNDDADDSYDAVDDVLTLAANDMRFVQVGLNGVNNVGTGGVGVTRVVAAADDFANAVALTQRTGALTAVTGIAFAGTEATQAGEPSMCGSTTLLGASAWVDFTAPHSGTWMLESKSDDTTDIAVYSGSVLGSLTLLNCATDDRIAVLVELTAGTTYRIRIGTDAPMSGEAIVVRAERTPAPLVAALVDGDGDGSSTDVGSQSDLAIVGGQPAIAYYDATNGELRFAVRSGNAFSDVLIDADGDGTSTDVGQRPSLAVLANGQPVVTYYDATNAELRFAERSAAGVWSDVLIDADGDGTSTNVGSYSDLIVLANGNPAVAYYDATNTELRFAQRVSGTWSDMLIDADGDGTSTAVGEYPGIVELANGIGVSYSDDTNSELRFARFSNGAWTDELVYRDALDPSTIAAAGVVLDGDGNPVVAATDTGQGNHVVGWWNGTTWDIEWDLADRHIAELDFECSAPRLLIDGTDRLHLVWTDCNYSGTMAISVRDPSGSWSVRDVAAKLLEPTNPAFPGTVAVWGTESFGAAFMPDGTLAVSFQNDDASNLWWAVGP